MKILKVVRFVSFIFTLFLISALPTFAQNMTSDSGYEIIDPTISTGRNDDQISTSSNYLLRESIGVAIIALLVTGLKGYKYYRKIKKSS